MTITIWAEGYAVIKLFMFSGNNNEMCGLSTRLKAVHLQDHNEFVVQWVPSSYLLLKSTGACGERFPPFFSLPAWSVALQTKDGAPHPWQSTRLGRRELTLADLPAIIVELLNYISAHCAASLKESDASLCSLTRSHRSEVSRR